jgi:hypothetical protein
MLTLTSDEEPRTPQPRSEDSPAGERLTRHWQLVFASAEEPRTPQQGAPSAAERLARTGPLVFASDEALGCHKEASAAQRATRGADVRGPTCEDRRAGPDAMYVLQIGSYADVVC